LLDRKRALFMSMSFGIGNRVFDASAPEGLLGVAVIRSKATGERPASRMRPAVDSQDTI
jgi:hypothetical protein